MKQISVSVDVYAAIWRNHNSGEETEDEILRRLLTTNAKTQTSAQGKRQKTSWAEDVTEGFQRLGGDGHLSAIYEAVIAVRKENGHRIPSSADAIIRRVIEEHSSDTESFKQGKDLYTAPNGLGAGFWSLR